MSRANRVIVYRRDLLPWSETFIKEQILALRRWRPMLVGERVVDGLPLDGLDVRLLSPPRRDSLLYGAYRSCQWLSVSWPGLVSRFRDMDAQLVHAHFGPCAVDIWPSVKALGVPMVVTLHGYDINIRREWWESGRGGWWRRDYPRKLLRLADEPRVRFVAVSEAVRVRARELGIPGDRISIGYVGVDTRRFQPAGLPLLQRPRRVLFIGRLVEKKGVSYLIRAFSRVRDRCSDAELVIAGDGPLRVEAEYLAKQLRLDVAFLGVLSADQVWEQLAQARVLCLPSVEAKNGDAEGFGLVLLEAQACGVPVVTSARGGSREGLLDGETGFRVDEGDVDGIAERLVRLLAEDVVLADMSARAVAFVRQHFDVRACASVLENLYDACLDGGASEGSASMVGARGRSAALAATRTP